MKQNFTSVLSQIFHSVIQPCSASLDHDEQLGLHFSRPCSILLHEQPRGHGHEPAARFAASDPFGQSVSWH